MAGDSFYMLKFLQARFYLCSLAGGNDEESAKNCFVICDNSRNLRTTYCPSISFIFCNSEG